MQKKNFDAFVKNQLTKAEAGQELFEVFKEPLIEEMNQIREQINSLKYSQENQTDAINVIIFGPTGSGKSSFIR